MCHVIIITHTQACETCAKVESSLQYPMSLLNIVCTTNFLSYRARMEHSFMSLLAFIMCLLPQTLRQYYSGLVKLTCNKDP